jgi:hypothetical protein
MDDRRPSETPPGFDSQTELAESADVPDPFLEALEAAEVDDEPYTDEERAAAREGWEAYLRGESRPWEEVWRTLFDEDDAPLVSTP